MDQIEQETQPTDQTSEENSQEQSGTQTEENNNTTDIQEELAAYRQIAQNAVTQTRNLERSLAEIKNSLQVPKTPEPEPYRPTDEDFQTSPATALERLLDTQLDKRIKPLQAFLEKQEKETTFKTNFERTVEEIPALKEHSDKLAPMVKQFIGDSNPTPQAINIAIRAIVGDMILSGNFPVTPPANNNNSGGRTSAPVTPPRNAPNSPSANPTGKSKLTEKDRRVMKSLGITDEAEYFRYMNAEEVTFN